MDTLPSRTSMYRDDAAQRTIYTLGHGDEDFAALEKRLDGHRVTTIVDVRNEAMMPNNGEFARSELEAITAAAGVGYRWLGDRLGPGPAAAPGTVSAGIDEVIGLALTATVGLLCVELEPHDCHRALLLAPRLQARGYRVLHIRGDGSTEVHQDQLGL